MKNNTFYFYVTALFAFAIIKADAQGIRGINLYGEWRVIDYFNIRPSKPRMCPNELVVHDFNKKGNCFSCEESSVIKTRIQYNVDNTGVYKKTYSVSNDGKKNPLPNKTISKSSFKWSLKDSILCHSSANNKINLDCYKSRVLYLEKNVMILFSGESILVYFKVNTNKSIDEIKILKDDYYVIPYLRWLIEHHIIPYKLSQTY